jgi:O-antigen/teichoic acid export membrane protein
MITVVRRSILFSAIERYGGLIFLLASTAIISRLLTPHEFGIYAVINAITGVIAASFQEFGGSNYLLQKPSLSEKDIRSAFTVTLCLSVLFAVTLFELRDVAAWFFSEEGLKIGVAASTLNFLILPFSITISTLLRRDMDFGTLAWCNVAGGAATAAISIALAVLNYSFMALIWGTIAGNVVVLVLLLASQRRANLFRPSFCGYRDIFDFGAYSSGTVIVNVFYSLAPQLILARTLNFNAVGLYGRASNITQMFDKLVIQVLNPVILPAISAHKRAGGDLRRIYLNAIELLAVVQWPSLLFFALMADPIILIWLGETWSEVVPLIRMLCIASLSLFAACLTYPVLVALGFVRDTLVSSLISLPPSLLLIFVASFFGVRAVAACALLTLPFQAIVALFFVGRRLALTPADLIRAILKSGIVTGYSVGGALVSMAIMEFSSAGPVIRLVSASIFAAAAWWLGLLMTKHRLLGLIGMATDGMAVVGPPIASATLQKIATRASARN